MDEHTPTSGPIGGPSADALFAAPAHEVRAAVGRALAEDLTPLGDLTASLVAPDAVAVRALVARRSGVLAGSACATEAFLQVEPAIRLGWRKTDGDRLEPGD